MIEQDSALKFLVWAAGIFFTVVILGMLLTMIKGWFDSVKDEILKLSTLVSDLFQRSENDRLGIKDCQLEARKTYATKTELEAVEKRVSIIEKG